MNYTIIRSEDQKSWDDQVTSMEPRDVYYYARYCELYRLLGDGEPYLFVYEESEKQWKVIYPFLKRSVSSGPLSDHYYDVTTPYGYGGPLTNSNDAGFIKRFRLAFHEFCMKEKIVTEFIRFHPLLQNALLFQNSMDVHYVRDTVYLDLTKGPEEMLRTYHKSHRGKVRKAMRENLTFRVLGYEEGLATIDTFLTLYYQTMDKNKASAYYYFSKHYFEQLLSQLDQHSRMAVVCLEDQIIAADILIFDGEYLHSHLNCADGRYLHKGANNLLLYEGSLWGKTHGFKYFHIGGGYESNEDSLFKYKVRFNPQGTRHFHIGTIVHNQPVYNDLIRLWEKSHAKEMRRDFFPLYRQ